jgi:hypothetical protein
MTSAQCAADNIENHKAGATSRDPRVVSPQRDDSLGYCYGPTYPRKAIVLVGPAACALPAKRAFVAASDVAVCRSHFPPMRTAAADGRKALGLLEQLTFPIRV